VPANGAETETPCTLPSGENVTLAWPRPLGPDDARQLGVFKDAVLSAVIAALRLRGGRSLIGGSFGPLGVSASSKVPAATGRAD
jgi:hypothetical protein